MVLDALIWIKNKVDPTLTFRRSCREGICGSCAMNIDGTNTLACTKSMDEIKGADHDLSAAAYGGGQGSRRPTSPISMRSTPRSSLGCRRPRRRPKRNGANRQQTAPSSTGFTSASCAPAARPRARAIGGTATAISARPCCCRPIAGSAICATRRPASGSTMLEDPFRLYRCHTIMNCAKACPKGLNPAKAIAEIKNMMIERQL